MKRLYIAIISLILGVFGSERTDAAIICSMSSGVPPPNNQPTVVTTHLDIANDSDGLVSLREAIDYVLTHPSQESHITFQFPMGTPLTITLLSALPHLSGDTLSINGSNRGIDGGRVRISGGGTHSIFHLSDDSQLSLDSLILTRGYNADNGGGAIHCTHSSLAVNHCQFDSCLAIGMGGAIYAEERSKLTISNSVFSRNSTSPTVGEQAYGGALAIKTPSPSQIYNCSFSFNSSIYGGAIYARDTTIATDYSKIGRAHV